MDFYLPREMKTKTRFEELSWADDDPPANAPAGPKESWASNQPSRVQASPGWNTVGGTDLSWGEPVMCDEHKGTSRPHQDIHSLPGQWSPSPAEQSVKPPAGPAASRGSMNREESGTPCAADKDNCDHLESFEDDGIIWTGWESFAAQEVQKVKVDGTRQLADCFDGDYQDESSCEVDVIWNRVSGNFQGVAYCPTDKEPFVPVNPALYDPNVKVECPAMKEALEKCYTELARGPRKVPIPEGKRLLICPLWAEDPTSCSPKYTMYSIQDVARHLHAEHNNRSFYCPLCWLLFDEPAHRDEHVRRQTCQQKPKPMYWDLSIEEKAPYTGEEYRSCRDSSIYAEIVRLLRPGLKHDQSMFWDNYTSFVISTVHAEMNDLLVARHWKTITGSLRKPMIGDTPLKMQVASRREQLVTKLLLPRVKEHMERFQRIRHGRAWPENTPEHT